MKAAPEAPFDSTPEFRNFTEVMRRVVAVPKAEMAAKLTRSKKPPVVALPRRSRKPV